MKIIKSRFPVTKLPPGKVVRQSDIDLAAEKSFVKKFGDRPAYMGYGLEGSSSLAAREYAEKVANRVYFKKLKSELGKTRKITATGIKSLKASGSKVSKSGLKIGKARGAMKADIIARTEADVAMDRIMERYTARKAKSFKAAPVKVRQVSKEAATAMGFSPERKFAPSAKVATQEDVYNLARSERRIKYKKPKVKTTKSNFETEFKTYINKEFKL
jgi:hypothetical protein